jgi:heme-degrading monooxygenase HmoA
LTNEYPSRSEQNARRLVRVWKARGTVEGVGRYCDEHFPQHVLPQLRAHEGFLGARVLFGVTADDRRQLVVMTTWTSLDAIKAFAGERYDRAVVEAAVRELLEQFDDEVTHFTIAVDIA